MRLVKPSFSIMAMSGHNELPYQYENPLPLIEAAGRTCYKTEDKISPGTAEAFVKMIEANGHLSVMEHSWETRSYPYNQRIIEGLMGMESLLSKSIVGNSLVLSGNIRMFVDAQILLSPYKYNPFSLFPGTPKHRAATVRIVCDRGVSHELVRHRLASYSQESTRYCNYSKKGDGHVSFIIPSWSNIKEGLYIRSHSQYIGGIATEAWVNNCFESERNYEELLSIGWTPQQARSVLPNSLKTEIVVTTNWEQWQHIFNMRSIGIAGKPHPQMLEIMQPLHAKFKEMEPEVFK